MIRLSVVLLALQVLLLVASVAKASSSTIVIEGTTSLPAEKVDQIIAKYQQQRMDFVTRQQLLVELNQLYHDAGFVSSGFVVAAEDASGNLRLRPIEGSLSRVEVIGATRLRNRYLSARVHRRVQEHVQIDDVQRTLRWLQSDPNINRLDAELLPGDEVGLAVLRLDVEDSKRFSVGLVADNYRSPALGAEGATLLASARNLSGYGDLVSFSAGLSDGSDSLTGRLEVPVTSRGIVLSAYYARSDSQIIESRFESLDIESQTDTVGLSVAVPLFDGVIQKLQLTLALENKESESSIIGVPFSFSPGAQEGVSETATAELGIDWERRQANAAFAVRLGYRKGFHALGATEHKPVRSVLTALNPTGADGKFGRWLLQGTVALNPSQWISAFHERTRLTIKSTVQIADDPLMALEKLSIGGARTVRGYRENTFVRDNGAALTAELRLPIWRYRSEPHPLNLQVVPFADVGWSWDDVATSAGARNSERKRRIASAGLGLDWRPVKGLRAQVFWAERIDDNLESGRNVRSDYDLQDDGIHFQISYNYAF